ncbi:hypothetical protein [Ciceribacter thiooxidans]|uniref:Chitinase class I n=1 Tax=Ciceribacter thiooxidans TaxID=1969821 RepID=A0ABV7I6W5_9HYPH
MSDERDFYRAIRAEPFGGRLTDGQVRGIAAIRGEWMKTAPDGDPRHLAYMLATAFHETARTMRPVRETLASTDERAIAILDRAYAAGRLPQVARPYWRRDGKGRTFLGRGFVQITHRRNYQRLSDALGIDLVSDPARAMEMEVAASVLVAGMMRGLFTGVSLADVFSGGREDWTGARRIVNGLDRAELVAGYGRAFLKALGVTGRRKAIERGGRPCYRRLPES